MISDNSNLVKSQNDSVKCIVLVLIDLQKQFDKNLTNHAIKKVELDLDLRDNTYIFTKEWINEQRWHYFMLETEEKC